MRCENQKPASTVLSGHFAGWQGWNPSEAHHHSRMHRLSEDDVCCLNVSWVCCGWGWWGLGNHPLVHRGIPRQRTGHTEPSGHCHQHWQRKCLECYQGQECFHWVVCCLVGAWYRCGYHTYSAGKLQTLLDCQSWALAWSLCKIQHILVMLNCSIQFERVQRALDLQKPGWICVHWTADHTPTTGGRKVPLTLLCTHPKLTRLCPYVWLN